MTITIPKTTTTTTTSIPTTTTTDPRTWKCPSGWIMFDRGTYKWCMKNYYGSTSYDLGLASCRTLDSTAKISGFQIKNERATMQKLAVSAGAGIDLIIGAYRTPMCLGQVLTPTCTRLTSFYWTDGYTTGTAAFDWSVTQPDNNALDQNAVKMWTADALLDDWEANRITQGAVCGRIADYN